MDEKELDAIERNLSPDAPLTGFVLRDLIAQAREAIRLREALQCIANGTNPMLNGGTLYTDCVVYARAALEPKP